MQRSLTSVCFVAFGAAVCVFASRAALSSGQSTALVRLQSTTPGSAQTGNANITGTFKAGQFEGSGSGLTNVNAEAVGGFPASSFGRLSSTNNWSGGNTFSNPGNSFTGSGSGLTNVNADLLNGLNSTAFLQSIPVPLSLSGSNGASGIIRGSNSSGSSLAVAVRGTALSVTGQTYAGYFDNQSVGGTGLSAQSQGPKGMEGISSLASGTAFGGYFEAQSTSGFGAMGKSLAATGPTVGLLGQALSTSGTGVSGIALATGVLGTATATNGIGVQGQAAVLSGTGVLGSASATNATGVKGENSNATSGVGVFGLAGPRLSGAIGSLIGVFGEANGVGSAGIYGFNANDGIGVFGRSSGSGGTAIIGQGIGGARAAVFSGEVLVNGRIMKDYGAGNHEAVPIAYGTISSVGTVVNGSGNFTSVWNAGTSSYEITLTGLTYTSNMTSVVTAIANTSPRIGCVAPAGTDLGVTFFNTSNTKVQVGFHFVVYDPQ